MKKIFICFAIVAGLSACSQFPHIYLGDTTGDLYYTSHNRQLQIHWIHASKVVQFSGDTVKADSLKR